MNKTILPISPGLLISMALRYDHAFAMPSTFMNMQLINDRLEDRQIKLLREVALVYQDFKQYGQTQKVDSIAAIQLLEEATGEGFYKESKEQDYRNIATIEALREAEQLANDKVSYSGVIPILTVEGED